MLSIRFLRVFLVSLFIVCNASLAMAADVYNIDRAHTNVEFTVRHLVISKVRGRFNEFAGTIIYDEHDITRSSLKGMIKVASIDTDNVKRDAHLLGPDFFDAQVYPEIVFKSTKVEKVGDQMVVVGKLTIHGTTKEVRVPFIITGKFTNPSKVFYIGFEARLRINRQDFGISYSKMNGSLIIGNTVNIKLLGEAVQQSG